MGANLETWSEDQIMMKFIAAAILALFAIKADAQVVLPQCTAPSICLDFSANVFKLLPGGYLQFSDGSTMSTASGGGGPPSGPAGGNLGGTYPNPAIASLPAISGALLTSITGANVGSGVPAANIAAGSLGSSVIVSSIAVGAVTDGSIVSVSGSKVTGNISGNAANAAPSGAAGGNLGGTYPNPTVASLPAISGAALTNLTAANISAGSLGSSVIASSHAVNSVLDGSIVSVSGSKVTGNISGQAGSVASGGVDFSTITTALALKMNISGGVFTGTVTTPGLIVTDSQDLTKKYTWELSGQSTGVTTTISPLFTASKTLYFQPIIDSTGNVIVQNGSSGLVLIGANTQLNGSNAGIQYSTLVSNRAQLRVNAYGNHAGVAGVTFSKSRGTTIGADDLPVIVGDPVGRITIAATASTPGSHPNVADLTWSPSQVNATTMGMDLNFRQMNNAGTLATKMYLTSEGKLYVGPGISTSPATTIEAEGNLSWGTSPTKSTGATNGSLTLAAGATMTVQAPGNFVGPASGITNFMVYGSSMSADTVAINSLSFVTLSTLTVVTRGGRPATIRAIVQIVNGSAAAREYTMKIQKNGVDLGSSYIITTQNTINGNATQNISTTETSTTAGTNVYTIMVMSSSTGATQTATNREITVMEF